MTFCIKIVPQALEMLKGISDRRIQEKIFSRMTTLQHDPEKQGNPLIGELAGYRTLRAVGQRYRIIYKVERATTRVLVVAIGIRKEGDKKDIYALARKLFHLRLL